MFKKIFLFFLFFLFFLKPAFAAEIRQVTIVNPIRGEDFWIHGHSIIDTPIKQYELISRYNLPATWLVRYDALKNNQAVQFLKGLNQRQEIGLFLEITPTHTKDASVLYNQNPNWHYAESVFLTGYSQNDRKKLIDKSVEKYKEIFGVDPKSVGAWWIDAFSLSYLKEKYNIEANLDVADQHSTDQYQVWGQYFSTPFYPSKLNALVPASSQDQKIGVVTLQWATRDPFNGYGNGVFDSTYSIQANDYLIHKLDSNYFKKLIDIYPQVTVGLENDFKFDEFGKEYENQVNILAQQQSKGLLQTKTMSAFAAYYKNLYPGISPDVLLVSKDPLGGDGQVVWYQTTRYRVGWFYGPYGSAIRDLRVYNDSIKEVCYDTACKELNLAYTVSKALDDVTFSTRWVLDEGRITDFNAHRLSDSVEISYKNQGGTNRSIKFFENDISIDNKISTVQVAILNVTSQDQNQQPQTKKELDTSFVYSKNSRLIENGLKFGIFTFLFFFLPGQALTGRYILSLPAGWVIFTSCAFLLGYLKVDNVIWILPVVAIVKIVKDRLFRMPVIQASKINILAGLIILLGSFSWLMTVIKNGLFFGYGLGYWGPNGHDGIWHLSLIGELQKNIPPNNPVFAGERLQNYHYFFDLLLAKSGMMFSIDSQDLLFRFFPVCIAILTGVLLFAVVTKLTSNKIAGIFSLFFLYFGGSFGWVVSFLKNKDFGGETIFWAQQSVSTLLNPPFAISLTIFLAGLYIFSEIYKNRKISVWKFTALIFLWGSLIEFKAYGGVLLLFALGVFALEKIILQRDFFVLKIFLPIFAFSAAVFIPNNLQSSSLFEFKPLWLIQSMIDFQDRLGWQRLSLAIQSGVLYKVILGYLLAIMIFLAGNFGTRLLVVFAPREMFVWRVIFYMGFAGFITSMLFVQKGNSWNVVQFFYYSIFTMNIFAGVAVARIWPKQKILTAVTTVLIIAFTIPTTVNTLGQYLPSRPPARLSNQEFEALNFLSLQPQGTVLTEPYDEKSRINFSEPVPLVAYTSTAYVSAFSKHPTFLEDTINLEILGVDYKGRLNLQRDFFRIKDRSKEILEENHIEYIYLLKILRYEIDEGKMGVKKIFENQDVQIFKKV